MSETVSPEDIMKVTKASQAQMKLWDSQGMKDTKVGREYDLRKWYIWYRDNVYRPNLAECTGEEGVVLDVMTHRARYEKARAQKYEIKLQRLKDQYVPSDEAEIALYELGGLFEEITDRLPGMLAKAIVNKNEADMLVAVDNIVRNMLLDYSRMGDDTSETKD